MSTLKLSLLLSLVLSAASCSQLAPFEDRRREPGTEFVYVGASRPGAPVICYNPLFYNDEEVKAVADSLCAETTPGTSALKVENDVFSCRFFVPSKAYYKCISGN